MNSSAKFVLLLALGFVTYKYLDNQNQIAANLEILSTPTPVAIFLPRGTPPTLFIEELKIRGLASQIVEVDSPQSLGVIGTDTELKAAQINDGDRLQFPIYKIGEKIFSRPNFEALMQAKTAKAPKEKSSAYIVVYGPQDCPKTARVKNALEAAKVPFEYRDVNDPNVQPKFMAISNALFENGADWPIVDVSGKWLSHPTAEDVSSEFKN